MADNLSEETRKKLAHKLAARKVRDTCPMCGHKGFIMADGYFNNVLQNNLSHYAVKDESLPSIAIVCANCGFISQHALGVLGVINSQEFGPVLKPEPPKRK